MLNRFSPPMDSPGRHFDFMILWCNVMWPSTRTQLAWGGKWESLSFPVPQLGPEALSEGLGALPSHLHPDKLVIHFQEGEWGVMLSNSLGLKSRPFPLCKCSSGSLSNWGFVPRKLACQHGGGGYKGLLPQLWGDCFPPKCQEHDWIMQVFPNRWQ